MRLGLKLVSRNLSATCCRCTVRSASVASATASNDIISKSASDDVLKVVPLSGRDQGIVLLGFNRPKAKNSFNRSLVTKLEEALDAIRYDQSVRVVILKSEVEGVFCAGADLKERLTLTQIEVGAFVSRLRRLMCTIEELPVPVLAALDGAALGGGLEMALATDIRVASNSARLGLVETKLAILPGAGGTQRLPRLIGPARAKELIFTGRVLSGDEAKEFGLVNHCVREGSAYDKTLEIAREIVPNGPVGVRMAKSAIDRGSRVDLNSGLAIEELCYAQVLPTKDRIEGLKAFGEKRKPVYIGE
ncbi:hypothetical protein AAG570_011672 [Ranatra chinensis]|uniref:Methylglutaconyl-CoA hydratase n=1 Tax=Ranatra chinensis TaxID=642074 RepID=A0ABD0Z4W2_9HEMI